MSKCIQESRLYIVVEEADRAIPLVEGATLFLFNRDHTYLTSIPVSAADIAGNVPIILSYNKNNPPLALVWGNLGSREQVSPPIQGNKIEDLFIYVQKDAEGYVLPSDDMFFGQKQLAGEQVEYVTIYPKPGRIFITVKGLADTRSGYHFRVESPLDGYDFGGVPVSSSGISQLKLSGIFTDEGYLVTPEAYNMINFPSSTTSAVKVKVYRDPDSYLISTEEDIDAQPIVIISGKTTNVLIDVRGGKMNVSIAITNWDEISQWKDW